jgi:hypothetical protein
MGETRKVSPAMTRMESPTMTHRAKVILRWSELTGHTAVMGEGRGVAVQWESWLLLRESGSLTTVDCHSARIKPCSVTHLS